MKHLETERKFLIEMPDVSVILLNQEAHFAEISQTYTLNGIRLRRWSENGDVRYIKTEKKALSDLTRIETEDEITYGEYCILMKNADTSLKTVNKIRYMYPYKNKLFEIDVFPFWKRQAFCEIELSGENEKFEFPEFIKVIKEVTHDAAYRNFALAGKIPAESI